MAAVVAIKPPSTATKMKKPSLPAVQTGNTNSKSGLPSASPSSSAKRLPGQTTPQSATNTNTAAINGTARSNRRPHRISTRMSTTEAVPLDKKVLAKKMAEPYVASESFILRKYKGRTPSLIVHLHPTHFRFDQQDGSFSYQSEMRVFIEHLQKKTIPHDMLEELRKAEVQFYDGWLIVRIVDHKSMAADAAGSTGANDDEKLFSIHNYNNFITPSPYGPYPTKEQRSDNVKQERLGSVGKENIPGDLRSDDTIDVMPKNIKPQPKTYHVALRPTELSRHIDMTLDAITPDPKSLTRKQSQIGSRTPASGQPPTPIGTIPSTPLGDKPPPAKKQKLKIDPKDMLEYEARVINATAPPLFLDPVYSFEEAELLLEKLSDPWHDEQPPSPKSRKRTVAELAADDAHAKAQERFMLIMDERNSGNSAGPNAAGVDNSTGSAIFQPRFEKFNALDNIKREIAEKKQRDKDRQLQEDEARRGQQQQDEERKKIIAIEQRRKLHLQQQQQQQQQMQQMQQQAQAANLARQHQAAAQRAQANGIPPQMQNQMAQVQASSPIIRQGTPLAASSPVINHAQGGHAMSASGSQQGMAASPPRPGSAVQHTHPGAPMARGPSNQGGVSRTGTPQLAHNTPGMRNATPVMRQGTPTSHMTQASPHSMAAPTPQMGHAGMGAPGQMPNNVMRPQLTPQQMALHQQRQQQLLQQQVMSNSGQVNAAHIAQLRAQQQAQVDQNALLQRQQQQQQSMQQIHAQNPQMSPNPNTNAYKAQLAKHMELQLQKTAQQGGQNHGSPTPNQMSVQQQQHQLQQQQARMLQAQQAGHMNPQQRQQMSPQVQAFVAQAQVQAFNTLMRNAAQKYGGNMNMISAQERQVLNSQAQAQARHLAMQRQQQMRQQQQQHMNLMAQRQQQQLQQGGGGQINPGMAAMQQQHQHQAAQLLQQQQMANVQTLMQAQQQQQYQQQMNMMAAQQQHGGAQQ